MQVFRILQKFRMILSRHQKIRIIELGIIMICGGFMEMLSVSLILPFTQAILEPDKVMANHYVQAICAFCGVQSDRTFLVLLALVMAVIYILKNIFLLVQMYVQNRFVFNNMFATQQRLLRSYLSRPYEYFLSVNSGEVLRVISNDTSSTFSLLTSLLSLCAELTVSFILIATIFFIAPGITIGMAVLLIVSTLLILNVLRPILRKAGLASQEASKWMNQWLLQSIQGIKEVKIMRKEGFFEKNFEKSGLVSVKMNYRNNVLGMVPRFMIEAVAMSSFFIVVAMLIYRGSPLEAIVPMLSSVAIAAIRLLPSVNRISQSMAQMAFGEPMLDKMIENMTEVASFQDVGESEPEAGEKTEGFRSSVELSDIEYRYPSGEFDVLSHAGMKIGKGQSVGIVGASGAGKTTAVDILLGLLKPQNGQVLVDGTDIRLDMNGWLSQIGYIPQVIFMLDGSIRDNVAFGVDADKVDDAAVWTALKEAALDEFVRGLPDGLDTQLGERGVRLSGGQRQRVGIARALYNNPEILFFDEATSALDNETEAAIMESINHLHGTKTMIIIAHRLTTIENCDIVYRVENQAITRDR